MAQKTRKLKIAFTGGGSGGHIFPLIAVAEKLREKQARSGLETVVRYFGNAHAFTPLLEEKGIYISRIIESKWRRYFSLLNIVEPFKLLFGFFQALWKLYWYMPDVVFSKGGPGSLVILITCRMYLIPVIIHESDAVIGFTNAIASSFARVIELSFPETTKQIISSRAEVNVVGNPIRNELLSTPRSARLAKEEFGFKKDIALVLFLGGSQGAQPLNSFVLQHLETLLPKFQILHQTGANNFDGLQREYEFISKNYPLAFKEYYKMAPFFVNNLRDAMSAADIVVSRAGSGSIFEIAAFSKPCILVPLPDAANNHQLKNAYAYKKTGAAVVIEQENLLIKLLMKEVEEILQDSQKYEKMSHAARSFFRRDAAEKIADDIMRFVQ